MEINDDETPFSLTYMTYDPKTYDSYLETKIQKAMEQIGVPFATQKIPLELFVSPSKNYRHRCRFGIERNTDGDIWYSMWEHGEPNIRINSFPLASTHINSSMQVLLQYLKNDPVLGDNIRAANFLSTSAGDLSISLIYAGPLPQAWHDRGALLHQHLLHHEALLSQHTRVVGIIGRSKGLKVVVGREEVMESFQLRSGPLLRYEQLPDAFSNPNPEVNRKSLDWLCDVISGIPSLARSTSPPCPCLELLELYCGNGNHTVALAGGVCVMHNLSLHA